MENIARTLQALGFYPNEIKAIMNNNSEEAEQTAMLLIALFDDRHEYMD